LFRSTNQQVTLGEKIMAKVKAGSGQIKMPNLATLMALIHINVYPEPLRECRTNDDAVKFLESRGMIEVTQRTGHSRMLTEKGTVWLEAVMNTPLPVPTTTWTIPQQGE
jgi:hypothetical protein